jgi:hypothetical protein
MLPEGQIVHRIGRRLRVRIPSKKGDRSFFSTLTAAFAGESGIAEVQTNHRTGSLFLVHDLPLGKIADIASRNGLFALVRPPRYRKPVFRSVAESFHGFNGRVKHATGGELDIFTLIFLGLILSGLYQISRGNLTLPAWYTAYYYALQIFSRVDVDEIDGAEPQEEWSAAGDDGMGDVMEDALEDMGD